MGLGGVRECVACHLRSGRGDTLHDANTEDTEITSRTSMGLIRLSAGGGWQVALKRAFAAWPCEIQPSAATPQ